VSDLQDLDLRHGGGAPPPDLDTPPRRASSVWLAVTALVAAAGAAAYFAFVWRQPVSPAQKAAAPAPGASTASPPLGGTPDPVTLPPLDASDTLVRTLVQGLTESPAVMAWLPTTGLIRNFTVVVANISEGVTPAKHLKVLRPAAPYRIATSGGTITTDPRSYDRYSRIADALASVRSAISERPIHSTPRWSAQSSRCSARRSPTDRNSSSRRASATATPTSASNRCCRRRSSCCAWARATCA
jgi:hypothetical protein